jgi:uncharacterized membrane protein
VEGEGTLDWLQFGAQWLHVILGITWFGSVITANFILIPALNRLPLERQREIAVAYGEVAERVIGVVAPTVILLGILRGTVFGQVRSLDSLTTGYGLTWLLGLVAATATFAWGKLVLEPAIGRMNAIPAAEALLPDGQMSPAMAAAVGSLKQLGVLELLGFLVIFTCMILMRFGY